MAKALSTQASTLSFLLVPGHQDSGLPGSSPQAGTEMGTGRWMGREKRDQMESGAEEDRRPRGWAWTMRGSGPDPGACMGSSPTNRRSFTNSSTSRVSRIRWQCHTKGSLRGWKQPGIDLCLLNKRQHEQSSQG